MQMRSRSRSAAGDRERGHGGLAESATYTAQSRKKWKRNVKGETPLHRACIRGDAQQAFTLIQQGHPLCERDNAGWTPLHEACNYGWLEIVSLLLNKGVSPNDNEDSQCGGTTVLHDALANGWLSVAQLLIDNGASLTARDSEGRTPADSLNNWVKNLKEPDAKVMELCEGMLAQLKSRGNMESELTICITDVRSLVPNEAKPSSLASSPPCQRPRRNSRLPQRPSSPAAARSRSRSSQRDGEDSEGEDGYLRVWSVECTWSPEAVLDETPGPSGGVSREEPGQERSALTESGRQEPGGMLDGVWLEVERTQEAGSSNELDRSCPPPEPSLSRSPSHPADATMDEGSRSPTEAPIQTPEQSAAPSLPPPLRVRVCVLDKVFLIPVPHSPAASPTVSWLATEAAGRSALVWGYRPQLTLSSHRALLAPDDILIHTLRDNEQVEAEVLSWDLPPIAARYKIACQSLCVEEDAAMVKILELQQGASSMDLSGLRLGTERLVPLLRSLRLHVATQELRLADTRLALPALGELLATLLTLPNLTLLDLSHNLINRPGLMQLSEGARLSAQTPFPSLRELNLSLNPLGEGSWQSLAVLLECCPLLATLRLRGCELTAAVLQHPALSCALRGCRVKTLELSGNPLGCLGLHPLARTLRHLDLTHLLLDSVTTLPCDGNLTEPLLTYLGQGNNALTHLSLANNDFNDSNVQQLASCIPSLSSLAFLDLSQNPGIGSPGLQLLLEALEKRDSCLQVLDLSGCSVNQQDSKEGTMRWYVRELRL